MAVLFKTAAVHPHDPLAFMSCSGASPVLRTTNLCDTVEPWEMVPKSYDFSGKNISGVPRLLVSLPMLSVTVPESLVFSVEA